MQHRLLRVSRLGCRLVRQAARRPGLVAKAKAVGKQPTSKAAGTAKAAGHGCQSRSLGPDSPGVQHKGGMSDVRQGGMVAMRVSKDEAGSSGSGAIGLKKHVHRITIPIDDADSPMDII